VLLMAAKRLTVGKMRASGHPGANDLAQAHAAQMFGADFCYFNPADVDLDKGTIRGWRYEKSRWHRRELPLPDVIINDRSSSSNRKVWKALSRRVPFTAPPIGDKAEVFERMRDGGFYPDMQIPTVRLSSFDDVEDFLNLHQTVVVKPENGSQGRKVFCLGVEDKHFRVNDGSSWQRLDAHQLRAFYHDHMTAEKFIAQKFIDSTTKNGTPFDIRLHVRRNRVGRWSVIRLMPRIGAGRSITSNLACGGSIASLKSFLELQFGEVKARKVERELRDLAKQMPQRFQALYRDRRLDALGIDIGLDASGKPWLFEINDFPGTSISNMEAAIARVGYALYVAENPSKTKTSKAVWQAMADRA
jgi:glutathione synthase/RimK-type ligase-like ATP-grasp enzyme